MFLDLYDNNIYLCMVVANVLYRFVVDRLFVDTYKIYGYTLHLVKL